MPDRSRRRCGPERSIGCGERDERDGLLCNGDNVGGDGRFCDRLDGGWDSLGEANGAGSSATIPAAPAFRRSTMALPQLSRQPVLTKLSGSSRGTEMFERSEVAAERSDACRRHTAGGVGSGSVRLLPAGVSSRLRTLLVTSDAASGMLALKHDALHAMRDRQAQARTEIEPKVSQRSLIALVKSRIRAG